MALDIPGLQNNTEELPSANRTDNFQRNASKILRYVSHSFETRGIFFSLLTLITLVFGLLSIIGKTLETFNVPGLSGLFNLLNGIIPYYSLTYFNVGIISLIQVVVYTTTFIAAGHISAVTNTSPTSNAAYMSIAVGPLSLIDLVALLGIWKLKRWGVYVYFSKFFLLYLLIIIKITVDIAYKTGAWDSLLLIFPFVTYRWGILNIVFLIAVIRKWSAFR